MTKVLTLLTAAFAVLSAICGFALGGVLFYKFIKKSIQVKNALISK